MHKRQVYGLLGGAGLGAIMVAGSPAMSADDSDIFTLEEITVTAQKREQSQQDVPISLTAFSGDFLETIGAENLRDINAYTPGLEVSGVTQPRFKLRGVETDDFGVGTDPAVGVFIDGVYASRSGSAVVFFSDVERIEVLKGPQGTLFGRNTAAGAISIHTRKPVLGETEAKVRLRYGRFDKKQIEGMLNLPLADTLAMRANFLLNKQDGYATDAVTKAKYGREDNVTGRLQFRWEPSESTTYNLAFEFDHTDQDEDLPMLSVANGTLRAPEAATTIGGLPGHGAWIAGVAPLLGLPFTAETPLETLYSVPLSTVYGGLAAFGYMPSNPNADWDFFSDANSPGGANPRGPIVSDVGGGQEKRDLDAITLTIEHEFDWAKLTSVSSYKRFTSNNLQDDDGTNDINFYLTTDNVEKNEQIYQELRFSGESDGLTWTIGGSYFHEKAEQRSDVALTTNTVDTLLHNLGVTPGVLALSFNPADGLNSCETRFIDSLAGPIAFSKIALNCFNPAFVGTPLDGLSLEDVSNLAMTSFGGRLWTETMNGVGTFKAYSAFADATYALSDRLNVTAGIRYTHDSKKWQWSNGTREIQGAAQLNIPGVGNLADIHQQLLTGIFRQLSNPASQGDLIFDVAGLEGNPLTRKDSWSNISPRFAVDYRLGDDAMIYASYALGYKAGGYNSVQINSLFNNEKVWNVETGMKSQWFDDSVRFNFSLWKYKYKDKQSIVLSGTDSGSVPFYQTRTQDVSGKGVDIELLWSPFAGLRFFANAGVQDITCAKNCGQSATGDPTGEPSALLSFGGDYAFDLGNSGLLAFHADHSYRSARRENGECRALGTCGTVSYGGVSWKTGEAQNFTNARITWTNSDEDISVSLFANNIFGKRYNGGASGLAKSTVGAPVSRLSAPGVWGIDLTKNF